MTSGVETQIPSAARPASAAALEAVVRAAETVNAVVGRAVAWLALGTVLACFAAVYTRYALGVNFVWLQEAMIWQHAAVILLGAAYTMMTGGFVRVDIFYAKWSPRRRAAADLAMTLATFVPFLAVFSWFGWRFFLNSWAADEGSMNPGGLPDLWLLKGAVVAMCALLALQGLALVARCLLVLSGREDWAPPTGGHGDAQG